MRRITMLLAALTVLVAACGDDAAPIAADPGLAASDLTRETSAAPDEDLAAGSAAARALGGAGGEPATEMEAALQVPGLDAERLHAALNGLDAVLESRNRTEPSIDDREQQVQVSVVNSLWGQDGFAFIDAYLDLLARNYGAGVRVVDFAQAAEEARLAINAWVAEQTNDRITDLIPEGAVDALTRQVQADAAYLDATWASPFS